MRALSRMATTTCDAKPSRGPEADVWTSILVEVIHCQAGSHQVSSLMVDARLSACLSLDCRESCCHVNLLICMNVICQDFWSWAPHKRGLDCTVFKFTQKGSCSWWCSFLTMVPSLWSGLCLLFELHFDVAVVTVPVNLEKGAPFIASGRIRTSSVTLKLRLESRSVHIISSPYRPSQFCTLPKWLSIMQLPAIAICILVRWSVNPYEYLWNAQDLIWIVWPL